MKLISNYSVNNGHKIHFTDSYPESDPFMTPLVICPGLSETAEEYVDFLANISPRRGIVISFRGRGKSDSPVAGYGLNEHVEDLEGVVDHLSLGKFHLFAYSRGVPYAIGFTYKHPTIISSLILQDYPSIHKEMPIGWADHYIHNYLIPHQRIDKISRIAVQGIERDSRHVEFIDKITNPLLVLRGMLEGSLLTDDDIWKYKELNAVCEVIHFYESGHDIRYSEDEKHLNVIKAFLEKVDNSK